jgi:hypothetical protein
VNGIISVIREMGCNQWWNEGNRCSLTAVRQVRVMGYNQWWDEGNPCNLTAVRQVRVMGYNQWTKKTKGETVLQADVV